MGVFEDRHTFQAEGPVTAVSAAKSEVTERANALDPTEARRIIIELIRAAGSGDRTNLIAVYRMLFGSEGTQPRDLATAYFADRVLAAAENGRLLLVRGWSWDRDYPLAQQSHGRAAGTGAEPASAANDPARSAPKPPPPPVAEHKVGHLSLRSRTVATAPADRRRTSIGVGETFWLTAIGATGAVKWTKTGNTILKVRSAESVSATAHDRAESTTIRAKDDACGCTAALTFHVIEPSGAYLERTPGSGVWHRQGAASVGMEIDVFITPENVSFAQIEIAEADAIGVVSGFFVGTPLDGVHHSGHGAGNWVRVISLAAGKGSRVDGHDFTRSDRCNFKTPFAAGTFDWAIPWMFRVRGGRGKSFATVHQQFTIDSTGRMTVKKGEASGVAELNDPSSDF